MLTIIVSAMLAVADSPPPLILISIDGLKPDYVIEADKYNLQIPRLRKMREEGAYASGVKGVIPTVTFPSHTTIVTGVSPKKHGILFNHPFDSFNQNNGAWYWYAEDINAPTLWDVAADAGLIVSNVEWPVTVGANIDINIPQYWGCEEKMFRSICSPNLIIEMERTLGSYPYHDHFTIDGDAERTKFNEYILINKKPDFHLCYFSGLDTQQHITGPYSQEAFDVLEKIDELVGRITDAANRYSDGRATICIVSDHGFAPINSIVSVNAALKEAGLMQDAQAWSSGGSTTIILQTKNDEIYERVKTVLGRLQINDECGFDRIIEDKDNYQFLVGLRSGYCFNDDFNRPVAIKYEQWSGGGHGYLPDMVEMDASFFITGNEIPANTCLGRIDMRDIAPTLARLLNITLPLAEGRNLLQKE
ncbi:MAG: ectonucleotide pyrophosphatase/phosphodiesterase [Patescibacteria group bacterium]